MLQEVEAGAVMKCLHAQLQESGLMEMMGGGRGEGGEALED